MTGFRTGAIDLREAAVASALAGAVVVALGYASGLGLPVRNDAQATLEQPAPAPQVAAPATTAPPAANAPAMAMPASPSYAGASGGMAGMDMGGAGTAPTPAPVHPAPTPEAHDPAPAPEQDDPTCADLLAALPASDLPLVGPLTGPLAGSVTGTVDGLVGGLLGSGSTSSLTGTLSGSLAPVTDLLTTPLAGGDKSAPPCLPGQTTTSTVATREATR